MAQPPATPLISRELTRFIPFAAMKTFAQIVNNGSLVAEFDVSASVTDQNQILGFPAPGAFPGGANPPRAVGPFLDSLVFSPVAGTLLVEYAVDQGTSYRSIVSTAVPAIQATNISGLRITGRFVRVTYNTLLNSVTPVEFGVYVRST